MARRIGKKIKRPLMNSKEREMSKTLSELNKRMKVRKAEYAALDEQLRVGKMKLNLIYKDYQQLDVLANILKSDLAKSLATRGISYEDHVKREQLKKAKVFKNKKGRTDG
jgi:hypothetical protein